MEDDIKSLINQPVSQSVSQNRGDQWFSLQHYVEEEVHKNGQ